MNELEFIGLVLVMSVVIGLSIYISGRVLIEQENRKRKEREDNCKK